MTIYITSDLHFGHENILNYQRVTRDYQSADEMNNSIIRQINETVKPTDTLYVLGDVFMYYKAEQCIPLLRQIKCRNIHLILGNHDQVIRKSPELMAMFKSVQDYKVIKHNKKHIVLMHTPIDNWDGRHHGWYNFHGHTHSMMVNRERRMDIGWDSRPNGGLWKLDDALDAIDKYPNFFNRAVDKIIRLLVKLKSRKTSSLSK